MNFVVMIVWSGMAFVLIVIAMIRKAIMDGIRMRASERGAAWDKDGNLAVPPMFERMFDKNMQTRDEKFRALEERIQVLEKIVTDSHKSSSLSDEIERLRDKT